MDLTTVYDATGTNLPHVPVPPGVLLAGYVTGTNGVAWSLDQWALHPNALRIDQSPVNTALDELADVIDMETGAATLADLPGWYRAARANFAAAVRPGQRAPAIYMSRSSVTAVANAMSAGGVTIPAPLWVAQEMPAAQAAQLVETASGPFPIVGVQYQFNGLYDVSVFSTTWLNTVSRHAPAAPPKPGVMSGWRFCSKCTGLFFGPKEAVSHCPAGGQHNGSGSHDFTLGFDQ